MAFLSDNVLDNGLAYLVTNGDTVEICTTEPTNYTEATTTYSKGSKSGLTVGAVGDRSPDGRKVTVPQITDGACDGDGSCGYWALTNGSDELLATGSLASAQQVYDGNTFTLTAFDIGIPDPT